PSFVDCSGDSDDDLKDYCNAKVYYLNKWGTCLRRHSLLHSVDILEPRDERTSVFSNVNPKETLMTIYPKHHEILPIVRLSGSNSVYSSIFEPLNHVTGVLTYSLLSIGVVLLLLLMIIVFIYRRRRTDCKAGKHPFLISFNPSRRIHSGSGNDSFGLGGGSDLTTSGVPLDLSTLEPLWNQEVNSLYGIGKSDLISFEQVTQISAANIRFQRYIGCGAFGKVWEGWLHVNDVDGDRFEKVALKVRNRKSLTEAEFRREATLMHRYQHANIVRFFGVSFDSPGQQCLVLEMMDQGNLRDYLHRARPRIAPNVAANMFAAAAICAAGGGSSGAGDGRNGSEGSSMNTSTTSTAAGCGTTTASNVITLTAQLDLPALIGIMRDIAQGCRYLEEQHFVHRDIAARNCLVSHSHPSGRIVKLCDFGLARDIYKNDCYLKRNEPKLPVRWMSPEAIRDGLFTTKSDVWAFAVTCWEVMTLGADPFYGRANLDVMNLVIGGHVLGRPENCPDELYNQMLQCWSRFSEMRPSFVDLTEKMNEFVQRSHDSGSVFAGAFIVSLPLPRSLPDSSCQPMFACSQDERQPQQPELVRPNNNNKCQRRASLNEYHSNSQLSKDNTFTLPQCHTMTRGRHNSQRVARQPPNLPVCHEQDTGCANFLGPRSMDLSLSRPGSMRNHSNTCGPNGTAVGGAGPRVENRTYLVGSAATTGYECALSDPSTEQTTLVTTTTGTDGATQGSVNGTAVLDPTLFTTPSVSCSAVGPGGSSGPGLGGRLNAPEKTVYQQQDTGHETRPVSLFDNPCSPGNASHPQSGFYRSLSYRNPQGINQGQMVNINRSMTQSQTHSAGVDQPNGSGSTTGPSLAAYWLVGTGGGVDSQGYERPTWTSASPSMHGWMNSQTQLLNQRASGSVILKTSMEPIGLQDLTNEQKTLRGTISG
ncbi:Proto-oncogene tyrosine-protein kinase ROS, partial [Fasciola gigantica]